jgi:hypothetical protein
VQPGHELEVHAEHRCDQVQWQEDRGQCRQGPHDVVGAVALGIEVHLHRGFGVVLQAAHMVDHPVNVLQHIPAAHLQQFVFAQGGRVFVDHPVVQGFVPIEHGRVLVIAQVFELVQRQSCLQQGVPAAKACTGVEQFGLPVVQLAAQFPS